MIFKRRARAGGFADRRYQRGLRSWQVKNRRLFLSLCGPFVAAGIVVGILDRDVVAWSAGLVAGGFLALWIALRDTPPRYVEKWRDGAEGERKAEKALRPLERSGWHVVHDVQNGHGNYDHIAVGPTGVYLLETKNLQGVVNIQAGVPRLDRRHDPDAHYSCEEIRPKALGAAARLKGDIERRTGHRAWVQAVVVFWSEFPEGLVEADKCVFIEGSRLCEWLRHRPERLGEGDVELIANCVAGIGERELCEDVATVSPGLSPA
jgi:hypothetical protein